MILVRIKKKSIKDIVIEEFGRDNIDGVGIGPDGIEIFLKDTDEINALSDSDMSKKVESFCNKHNLSMQSVEKGVQKKRDIFETKKPD